MAGIRRYLLKKINECGSSTTSKMCIDFPYLKKKESRTMHGKQKKNVEHYVSIFVFYCIYSINKP